MTHDELNHYLHMVNLLRKAFDKNSLDDIEAIILGALVIKEVRNNCEPFTPQIYQTAYGLTKVKVYNSEGYIAEADWLVSGVIIGTNPIMIRCSKCNSTHILSYPSATIDGVINNLISNIDNLPKHINIRTQPSTSTKRIATDVVIHPYVDTLKELRRILT